jgi:hypothetical protein
MSIIVEADSKGSLEKGIPRYWGIFRAGFPTLVDLPCFVKAFKIEVC